MIINLTIMIAGYHMVIGIFYFISPGVFLIMLANETGTILSNAKVFICLMCFFTDKYWNSLIQGILKLWLCSCYQIGYRHLTLWFFRTRSWCHPYSVHDEGEFRNCCHYHKSRDRTQQAFFHMNSPICRNGYRNPVLNGPWGSVVNPRSRVRSDAADVCPVYSGSNN